MYHDSAYGKEPIPVFDALSARDGFELTKIPLTPPATTQESQWLQVRQLKPDYVILWGFGVMNPVALKTAAKLGFPRDRILGVWWAASEEDVIPAGDAAQGLRHRRLFGARHQLSGDAGNRQEGLRRGQGQPRGQGASRLRSITPAASATRS